MEYHFQRGEVYVKARISKKVQSGIVSIPQGFWSSLMKGGSSANALTSDAFTDMGEDAAFHDTMVEIVKA
jgi:anaerobic selenocysteine-containing dehydrogenase